MKTKNCDVFLYDDNKDKRERLQKILSKVLHGKIKIKQIGAKSSNAYAYITRGYNSGEFVIKIPQRNEKHRIPVDSLELEYIAGVEIRKNIKSINYEDVIGYIKCPIFKNIPREILIVGYCGGQTLNEFLTNFYNEHRENINNVLEFILHPTIISILMQVLASLHVGQKKIEFVHYDLHLNNILIDNKTYPNKRRISYDISDKNSARETLTVPIINGNIAVIIDYGRSHTFNTERWLEQNKDVYKRSYKFLKDIHKHDIMTFDPAHDVNRFLHVFENKILTLLNKNKNKNKNIFIKKKFLNPKQAIKYIKNL